MAPSKSSRIDPELRRGFGWLLIAGAVLGICYGGWELAYPTPTRLPAMFVFPVSIALGLVGTRRVRG